MLLTSVKNTQFCPDFVKTEIASRVKDSHPSHAVTVPPSQPPPTTAFTAGKTSRWVRTE